MKTKTTLLLLAMASFLATLAPAQTVGGIKNITDSKAGISYNANARTVISNYTVQPEDHTILVDSTTAAPSGASYTVVFAPDQTSTFLTLTPAQAETINGTVTNAVKGRLYTLKITTSGTSSYTLTFSTNFKTTGTLATGTVSAKVFVMLFVFDGTTFNEVSRTTAM